MENFLEVVHLEQFLADHPNSLVFGALASRYIEQGNLEKALKIAEQGVEEHPQYAYGHFVLGLCYFQMNNYAKAKTHLEISTAYDEKNPRAWKMLGEINEKLDLPLLAEECFGKYFTTDNFGEDAARKFLKNEVLQMEDFADQEMTPDFIEEPGTAATGGEKDSEEMSESGIASELDKLFEDDEDEDFLEKTAEEVDTVFRETVGDEIADEESFAPELQEAAEDEISTKEAPKSDDDFSDAMDRIFSEFGEEESAPDQSKGGKTKETEALGDETPVESEELTRKEAVETAPVDVPPKEENNEDLLDFSSVVEDIISDREEEPPEATPEEPPSNTTMTIIREDETVSEVSGEPGEPEIPSESSENQTAPHFGRPPILSPTLGEIYISQGRYREALEVFEQLSEKNPGNQRFQRKINDIKMIMEKQSNRESDS